MPVVSEDVWRILYTVSRYLFPLLAAALVFLVLFYILSESAKRREKIRSLPGAGTVGELIVLSGGRDLDVNTWFPVPREGVLGSVRSCDLVIPCPGVRTKHLDFSWEDGLGLLIRPLTGCEVLINGVPVSCRTDASAVPLTHGSVLQVGSAVLRLHLFAALDNTVPVAQPPAEMSAVPVQPVQNPSPAPAPGGFAPVPPVPVQVPPDGIPPSSYPPDQPDPDPALPDPSPENPPAAPETKPVRPRRSDRWKEDFGE